MDQKPLKETTKPNQSLKTKQPSNTTKAPEKAKHHHLVNGLTQKSDTSINTSKAPKKQQLNNHESRTPHKEPVDSSRTNSESSTPEKSQDPESAEARKNRSRKQRRKNRALALDGKGEGSGVVVDQVFLPKVEEDVNDMDDTEKEIESFKRFCLDTSTLIKPKKMTVNWKDFSFKKNHSAH
uniref:FAM193 C-terminal domain-containing protein n=2 Tax=Ciona intestinalis TaxID=7719 RepID=H2Y224_CIOIN